MKLRLLALGLVACGNANPTSTAKEHRDISVVEEWTPLGEPYMFTTHDEKRNVTCWVAVPSGNEGAGISCIPDWQLKAPDAGR